MLRRPLFFGLFLILLVLGGLAWWVDGPELSKTGVIFDILSSGRGEIVECLKTFDNYTSE
ncbi:hypothetical protein SAMN05216375_12830 [Trichococcus ilyis]|uniref:Uncharacterized protein n=1 Tax=Trichococcus ilyis TaxID=640938 RepID=A0A143Z9K4_9LACT|nr:Hypothetical protein TR210_2641 [Trichococcus ilyis]SEJ80962.1 hypothetical protein SAMN05216375_12830 [Trichococcus ilyis]